MVSDKSAKRVGLNLNAFINKQQKFKAKVEYTYDELRELIEEAKTHYQNENTALVEVGLPINIVGDIHGQYNDLQRIFAAIGLPGKKRYLFLGDYIDRGPSSLECICSLLAYRLAFPSKVFLLRGNHECDYVNRIYGFWDELQARFKYGIALNLFKMFNELFTYLPLAALIRKRVLCMHGGLSPYLNSLDDIRNIPMPVLTIQYEGLPQDLLWADPKLEARGFEFNELRECSVMFGEDVVLKTCKKLGLDLIVRAHQVMMNGYGFFANRLLVTVFSAPRYMPELNNKAAVMQINRQMITSFTLLNPVKLDIAGAENFRKNFKDDSASAFSSMSLSNTAADSSRANDSI